jgi:hypothetical protein
MLLDDIIDLATDNKQPITVLLRKCIILASQLKNERLKVWANKELNGYDANDDLPPYRVLTTLARGNFSGYGGRQLRAGKFRRRYLRKNIVSGLWRLR